MSVGKGRGVFAERNFASGELIECAPVIIVPDKEWPFVSSTILSDYFFETEDGLAAMALGYASLYNHSFDANADYLVADDRVLITALCGINKDEEIFIDYGWDPHHYYENNMISKEHLEKLLEEDEEDV